MAEPLLSLDDALARMLAQARQQVISELQTLPTAQALGRVLAQPVVSAIDVPPADNSAMDGYALRLSDVPAPGTVLPVAQRIAAGAPGQPLAPGTAARIFTGAPVPAGADAVLPQEQCQALPAADGVGWGAVRLDAVPRPGLSIRRRGEDVARGAQVLAAGQRLSPQALGLAASVGTAQLTLRRRPRVALLSTGDELTPPGQPLAPGAIYDANRFLLGGLLQACGCDLTDLGRLPDRLDATRAALREAAQAHDLTLSSGGVSVGDEDHVKPALRAEGRLEVWQLAIKPGKPLAFGALRRAGGGEALFVGLPGNPVSAFVTFLVAVAPLLRALQGCTTPWPAPLLVRADFDRPRPDPRREFLRARSNGRGGVELHPQQGSGVLSSAVWADGLVDLAPQQTVRAGDTVAFLPLSALIGA